MMVKKIIYFSVLCFVILFAYQLYLSCFFEVIHLQNEDASQKITVFSGFKERYIVPGYHEKIPKSNYLQLDIRKTTRLSDILYVQWKNNDGWNLVLSNSSIIENYLDTIAYHFENRLPTKKDTNIPTDQSFNNNESGSFDFHTRMITRKTDNLKISFGKSIWKF